MQQGVRMLQGGAGVARGENDARGGESAAGAGRM